MNKILSPLILTVFILGFNTSKRQQQGDGKHLFADTSIQLMPGEF